jgi:hypothetical protein
MDPPVTVLEPFVLVVAALVEVVDDGSRIDPIVDCT